MNEPGKAKTYILDCDDGTRKRITVPADWKVTFGPAASGGNKIILGERHLKMPMALRFYESEHRQRAIFTDVKSFRDASIEIEIEEVRIQEKDGYVECDGVRKRTTFQAKTKEWVSPDIPMGTLPALPSDSTMFSASAEDEDNLPGSDSARYPASASARYPASAESEDNLPDA